MEQRIHQLPKLEVVAAHLVEISGALMDRQLQSGINNRFFRIRRRTHRVAHGGSLRGAERSPVFVSPPALAPPSISALASRMRTCARIQSLQYSPMFPLSSFGSLFCSISRPLSMEARASLTRCNRYCAMPNTM